LPNGHALLIGRNDYTTDLSGTVPGGDSNAHVYSMLVQELDSARNAIFEWQASENFKITDASHEKLTARNIDPYHCNAVEYDLDGNYLLSSRNIDEITKISSETGEMLWRLGGKNNQFTFVNDSLGLSYQHDIRRLPNGHITIFDNGNYHSVKGSRAVEY